MQAVTTCQENNSHLYIDTPTVGHNDADWLTQHTYTKGSYSDMYSIQAQMYRVAVGADKRRSYVLLRSNHHPVNLIYLSWLKPYMECFLMTIFHTDIKSIHIFFLHLRCDRKTIIQMLCKNRNNVLLFLPSKHEFALTFGYNARKK